MNERQAIEDTKGWLGDLFDPTIKLLEKLKSVGGGKKHMVIGLSFRGVNGYPAEVIAQYILEGREL